MVSALGQTAAVGDRDLSPLRTVERAVLERAKVLDLDPTGPEGAEAFARLVDDEIARLSKDFAAGRRSTPVHDADALRARALRNLVGFGPLETLLEDEDVWEVMVNAPDVIFVRRHRGRSGYHEESFHDDDHVARVLNRLLARSSSAHRLLDPSLGIQDAHLADGSRLHVVHRDLTRDGHFIVNLRRFTGVAFRRLDDLVELGTLDQRAAAFLGACVRSRCSILFSGAPGCGKTTLLTCCAGELDPALRIVVAEEVAETDIPLPNVAHLHTRPELPDRPGVGLRKLVSAFLRMAPDVAIVGEVRDSEALALVLTLSSGVTGYTTIHASDARRALDRLRLVAQLALGNEGLALGAAALAELVTDAIDLVVHLERRARRVEVTEVVAVEDRTGSADAGRFTLTPLLRRASDGSLEWTGSRPTRLVRRLGSQGFDVGALLASASARAPVTVDQPRGAAW
jgi:pilus assembly protein CpaF